VGGEGDFIRRPALYLVGERVIFIRGPGLEQLGGGDIIRPGLGPIKR